MQAACPGASAHATGDREPPPCRMRSKPGAPPQCDGDDGEAAPSCGSTLRGRRSRAPGLMPLAARQRRIPRRARRQRDRRTAPTAFARVPYFGAAPDGSGDACPHAPGGRGHDAAWGMIPRRGRGLRRGAHLPDVTRMRPCHMGVDELWAFLACIAYYSYL